MDRSLKCRHAFSSATNVLLIKTHLPTILF
jgi:hypothetical protein